MPDPTRESCLKRRMLFASAEAYHSGASDALRKPGWLGIPDRFTDPDADPDADPRPLHIDSALVGRIPEGVLVAFRGTLPPFGPDKQAAELVLADWLNNLRFETEARQPYPGRVHQGFAHSLDRLWGSPQAPGLGRRIRELLDESPQKQLFVTGHSKGGALANLAAWKALALGSDFTIRVLTIAAARAGNEEWRSGFEAEPRIRCTRYESALDIVPYVPLGGRSPLWVRLLLGRLANTIFALDYVPVGTRVGAGTRLADFVMAVQRGFLLLLRRHDSIDDYLSVLAATHSIDPGYGYDGIVCEQGCGHAAPY